MNSTDHDLANSQGNEVAGSQNAETLKAWGLGIVGAIAGGVAGWFIYFWIASLGFYALALPGALVGLGFGTLSRRPMILGGVFCAVVAFFLTAACEWRYSPFTENESYSYFLTHIYDVDSPMTLLLMVLGVVFAFWFGRGR